jgi:hypothetical protein
MNSPRENASPVPEQTSFFSLPPSLRYMRRALFWGGYLYGVGMGILVAAVLVAYEVIKLDRNRWDHWVSVMVLACVLIGQSIAQRAVRARHQPQLKSATFNTNGAEPSPAPDQGHM